MSTSTRLLLIHLCLSSLLVTSNLFIFYNTFKHLKHYKNPYYQKAYIRILLFIPLLSLYYFSQVYIKNDVWYLCLKFIKDAYMAWIILIFYHLLVKERIYSNEESLDDPARWITKRHQILRLGIFQYVLLLLLTAAISIVINIWSGATGYDPLDLSKLKLKPGLLSLDSLWMWTKVTNLISMSTCCISLHLLTKDLGYYLYAVYLQYQFWFYLIIIIAPFLQNTIVAILLRYQVLNSIESAFLFEYSLFIIEIAFFSVAQLWLYDYRPFLLSGGRRVPFKRALFEVLNIFKSPQNVSNAYTYQLIENIEEDFINIDKERRPSPKVFSCEENEEGFLFPFIDATGDPLIYPIVEDNYTNRPFSIISTSSQQSFLTVSPFMQSFFNWNNTLGRFIFYFHSLFARFNNLLFHRFFVIYEPESQFESNNGTSLSSDLLESINSSESSFSILEYSPPSSFTSLSSAT